MPLDQIDVDTMEQEEGTKEMSFFEHLEELRWHVIRSVIAMVIGAIFIFALGKTFFDKVLFWPKSESFPTYEIVCNLLKKIGLSEETCFSPPEFNLIATDLHEMFVTHLQVALVCGFTMAFPYIFYEIWRFVSPGLKKSERRYTGGIVFICSLLFMLGFLFGYFIISPFAISFLAGYQISDQVVPTIKLSSFVSSMTMLTLPSGFVFELPIVVYIFSKLGILYPSAMRKYRKHSFLVILVISALITPPDLISQVFIALPLYFLYEMSILICSRVVKNNEKQLSEI